MQSFRKDVFHLDVERTVSGETTRRQVRAQTVQSIPTGIVITAPLASDEWDLKKAFTWGHVARLYLRPVQESGTPQGVLRFHFNWSYSDVVWMPFDLSMAMRTPRESAIDRIFLSNACVIDKQLLTPQDPEWVMVKDLDLLK